MTGKARNRWVIAEQVSGVNLPVNQGGNLLRCQACRSANYSRVTASSSSDYWRFGTQDTKRAPVSPQWRNYTILGRAWRWRGFVSEWTSAEEKWRTASATLDR